MKRLLSVGVAAAVYFASSGLAPAQFVDRPGATRLQFESKDFGYVFPDLIWPKEGDGRTVVFVCWESGILPRYPSETQWVQASVTDSWQQNSGLEFRGWTECAADNAGIRIIVL